MIDKQLEQDIDRYLEERREEIIETLFTLCRVDSVRGEPLPGRPYGAGPAKALDTALKLCKERGFITQNDSYYCGSAVTKGGKSELGVLAHLDVVPVGDGWSGKPFEPYLMDGYAIGRGVNDDKSGAVVGLYAATYLKSKDLLKNHSIRLIFGCAEETGMDDLPHYLEHHEPPAFSLVPDSAFPVCCGEKGIYSGDLLFPVEGALLSFSGGLSGASNIVAASADAVVKGALPAGVTVPEFITVTPDGESTVIHVVGIPAHASRPEGSRNAIGELAKFLLESGLVSGDTATAMKGIHRLLETGYATGTPVAAEDEPSGKLTCVSGRAQLENGAIKMRLDIRYPVTYDGELVTKSLCDYAKEYGATCVLDHYSPPYYHDKNGPIIGAINSVYNEITGEKAEPFVMGGGTYARSMPNATGFGLSFPGEKLPFPKGRGGCHEADECQSIEGLLKAIKIYIFTLLALDSVVK